MFALYCCISLSGSVKASNEDRLNSDILSLGTYEQFIEPYVFRDEFGNSNIQRLFDVVVLLNAASERSEDSQCVWRRNFLLGVVKLQTSAKVFLTLRDGQRVDEVLYIIAGMVGFVPHELQLSFAGVKQEGVINFELFSAAEHKNKHILIEPI